MGRSWRALSLDGCGKLTPADCRAAALDSAATEAGRRHAEGPLPMKRSPGGSFFRLQRPLVSSSKKLAEAHGRRRNPLEKVGPWRPTSGSRKKWAAAFCPGTWLGCSAAPSARASARSAEAGQFLHIWLLGSRELPAGAPNCYPDLTGILHVRCYLRG